MHDVSRVMDGVVADRHEPTARSVTARTLLDALLVLLSPDPSGAGHKDNEDAQDDEDAQSSQHPPRCRRHRWFLLSYPARRSTLKLPRDRRSIPLPSRASADDACQLQSRRAPT